MARKQEHETTTVERVGTYTTTYPLLKAMYDEIGVLSKKKPDATLSESKVKLINRLLTDVRNMLVDEPQNKYLDLIDDAALPQYSDVILALSQYVAAMAGFRARYFGYDGADHRWFTE